MQHNSISTSDDFAAVFRAHRHMVRRALRQLGVDETSLEDATQDVFVILLRRVGDYDSGRSVANWLWGIARGVASTHRRARRRKDRFLRTLPPAFQPPGPEARLARRQAGVILDRFLSTLDEDKCAVFVLAELEGCTGPEIAQRLSVNLNTVYARLRAARARLDQVVDAHRAAMLRAKLATLLAWPAGWTTSPLMVGGSTTLAAVLVMPPALSTQPTISWTVGSAQAQAQVVGGVDRLPQIGTGVAKDSVEGSETDHLRSKTSVPEEEQPMRNLINTAAVLTTLAISGVAAAPAQAKPSAAKVWKQDISDQDADEAARVSAGEGQQTTSYIFDADTLEGEVLNPDGTMIMHRRSPRMPSMLVLRGHFVPELLRLGSDI